MTLLTAVKVLSVLVAIKTIYQARSYPLPYNVFSIFYNSLLFLFVWVTYFVLDFALKA